MRGFFFLSNPKSLDLPAGLYQDRRRTTSTENVPVQTVAQSFSIRLPNFATSCEKTAALSTPLICIHSRAASRSLGSAGERGREGKTTLSEPQTFLTMPLVASGPRLCDVSARLCRLPGRLRACLCSRPLESALSSCPGSWREREREEVFAWIAREFKSSKGVTAR